MTRAIKNYINAIDKSNNVLDDLPKRRGGEIGRHVGFKIPWPCGRAGSIPALGTSKHKGF